MSPGHTEWAQVHSGQTCSHVVSTGVTGEPVVFRTVCSLACTFSSGTCRSFGAPPPGLLITPCWSRRTGVLPPARAPFQPQSSKAWGGALALVFFLSRLVPLCHLEGQQGLGVAAPSGCAAVHPQAL